MSANESKHDIEKMRAAHKVLKEFTYELKPVVRGYNDRTLYINLATLEIKEKPVPAAMKKKFIGGKGYDLKLLWDAVSGDTRWDSPENEICIATGPIAGNTNYPGSGKSLVTTISPQTGIPIDSNVGGHFGPYLKFSGFDAMEIQGKADRDVLIYIDGNQGKVQIMEAPLGGDRLARGGRAAARDVRRQRARKAARVGGLGRPRLRARLDRLPELFLLGQAPQAAAPEAGRARRHRHRLPQQEDQGPGGQVLGPDRQVQQPGRHGDPAEDRPEAAQGDHQPRRQAVPDAHHRHRPPGRDHERLRPAAHEELPLRQPPRRQEPRLLGLEGDVHPERPRRLLVRLHHVLRPRHRQLRAAHRPLQGAEGAGRRPRVRDGRRLRLQPGHLRPQRRRRDQLLLRHLRPRHHLLRHPDRLHHGLLRERHPEQGALRRPGDDLGQLGSGAGDDAPDRARREASA